MRKHSKSPSWDGLEAIMMVGRHGTVRAAASVMGIAHTTLSHRISVTEAEMGVPAFVKTVRGYRPTEDGLRIITHAELMSQETDALSRYLDGNDARVGGTVKVSLNSSLLTFIVSQAVEVLHARHPDITINFDTGDRLADLDKREADIVLRMQDTPQPNLFGRRLCQTRSAVYAPSTVAVNLRGDLRPLPIVSWAGIDRVGPVFKELGYPDVRIIAVTPDINAQLSIARAAEVAVELPCYVGDQLSDLERLSSSSSRMISELWILTHDSLKHSKRIRVVIDVLSRVILSNRNLIEGVHKGKLS